MRNTPTLTAAALLALMGLPTMASAQNDVPAGDTTKSITQSDPEQATVKLDVRDARLRDVLEMLFKQASVNYLIEPGVDGFVTMKVADLPFQTALKLTLRSGSIPLVYTLENGVYIIRPRPVETSRTVNVAPPPASPEPTIASNTRHFEVIQLVHADPADFAQLLNIVLLPTGARFGNTGFAGFGGFGGLGGGGFAGMGGTGSGNGPGNNSVSNNGGRPSGVGTPGGTIIYAP